MKRSSLFLGVPFFLVIFLFLIWFLYRYAIGRPNYNPLDPNGQKTVEFVVKPGEKVYEIAQRLKTEGLINSATLFKIYVKFNSLSGSLQAGSYKIQKSFSLVEVVSLLRHGTFDLRLTFPEGWRREEMAQYLTESFGEQGALFGKAFLESSNGAEGFLFPDTYVVPAGIRAAELVKLMRDNFERRVDDPIKSDLDKQNLSLQDTVILASVVEREAGNDEDRPVIAGILLKRLRNQWPLEADATVQYAVAKDGRRQGGWWPEVTVEDLLVDSPYNTRKNVGLPPGPISNPGLPSIKAVVYPLETPYWFYLTDDAGVTHYAKTLAEHEENTSRFLRN